MIPTRQAQIGMAIGVVIFIGLFFGFYDYSKQKVIVGEIATSTQATSTEPVIPEPVIPKPPSPPALSITQVEDEILPSKDQYNTDGLLVSQVLDAEDSKLKKDNLSTIKTSLTAVQLEDTNLKEAEILTLYVRGKGKGTASLWIGDMELITLTMKDKEWLTHWDSITVYELPDKRFTQGQINNARVEFTGDIEVSNIRVYAEDQHSLTDNFDSYNDGDLNGQGGWAGSAEFDVGAAFKNGASGKGVGGVNLSAQVEIIKSTGDDEADGCQINYFYIDDWGNTNADVYFIMMDDTAFAADAIITQTGGMGVWDGSGWDMKESLSLDTWYKLELCWIFSGNVYTAQLDDGTVHDGDSPTWFGGWTSVDKLKIQTWTAPNIDAWADDYGGAAAPPAVLDDAGSQPIIWFTE